MTTVLAVPALFGHIYHSDAAQSDASDLLTRRRQRLQSLANQTAAPQPNPASLPEATPARKVLPEPRPGRAVRDRPDSPVELPIAAPDAAATSCYACNGGTLPVPVDARTGCGKQRRPYHTLLTASSGPYQLWQSRVMRHHWQLQRARDPCGEMGGFTRLLTGVKDRPDAFSNEMPTVVVNERRGGYPVINRPSSIVQFVEGGHLDKIAEEYIFIAETDHVMLRPMPNLASETVPAAFHFGYMLASGQAGVVDRISPGLGGKTDPVGPSPLLIHKEQLRRIARPWLQFTEKIMADHHAVQALGWVREMWGYAIAAASLGVKHLVLDALQFEGGSIGNHNRQLAWPLPTPTPVGPEGPLVTGRSSTPHRMPYYIFHYTYGIEYSREGLPMELQVGEWSLDKRHYMARHPPRDLDLPPACGHDRAHVLTALLNNASAALETAPGGWPTPRSPGSLAGFARLHLRPPLGGKGGPAAGELPTARGDATAALLLGTGPWTITGAAGGGSLRVEKVHFMSHGFLASPKGHGRWAAAASGGGVELHLCGQSLTMSLHAAAEAWELRGEGAVAKLVVAADVLARWSKPGEIPRGRRWRSNPSSPQVLSVCEEALAALPPADELSRRVEGSGPYRGRAGQVLLLRGGVAQANGELASMAHWRALSPSRILFSRSALGAGAGCADGVCASFTDCFILRLPLGLGGAEYTDPPQYDERAEERSLEWLIKQPAILCEDACAGHTLRKLTPADRAASRLATALEASAASPAGAISWAWAGFAGLKFNAGGVLVTPWGGGVWGAPPEGQSGRSPTLLAEFAGMQHLLRAEVGADGRVHSMRSARCHDNDRTTVGLSPGSESLRLAQ
eukprot:CAMPEP_0185536676 /NCGR_PEP_ID=MMETSP1366-20130426/110064_1 /TAXON_ID=38817 /ORGANISM="Gephyrocapsa oceanica, Strain RCC1303" /LENGTH=851 /DNA_ID=CAMNT_0028148397 /DNA_START=62 /DNA_END=2617 /DNA_ORIENTATION=-